MLSRKSKKIKKWIERTYSEKCVTENKINIETFFFRFQFRVNVRYAFILNSFNWINLAFEEERKKTMKRR